MITIRKAERRKAKLRLGIAGVSGSGKTMGALKLAHGIGKKICLIDTERGSGDLYASMYDYDIITLAPPYAPKNYIDAIEAAENAGYEVIIIDSLSHAWSDEGGLLDQVDKIAAGSNNGNSYTAWRNVTPQHRALVGAMLNSPAHIIATMRSKQEYALELNEKGKQVPRKIGMAPIQREGMEYEFTVFMDVNQNHTATASKDRTDMFKDEIFTISEKTGERLLVWLNEGAEPLPDPKQEELKANLSEIYNLAYLVVGEFPKEDLAKVVSQKTELILNWVNFDAIKTRLSDLLPKDTQEKNGNLEKEAGGAVAQGAKKRDRVLVG